jgi:hypothetical protein
MTFISNKLYLKTIFHPNKFFYPKQIIARFCSLQSSMNRTKDGKSKAFRSLKA